MAWTQTKFLDFTKLMNLQGAGTIVGLAMVYNDLLTINWALNQFNAQKPNLPEHMHQGMRIYFSRIHNGHLAEGIKFVEKIKANPRLRSIVGKCREEAQSAFDELCKCAAGGPQEQDFGKYVIQIRNRIAFHCDPSCLKWAVTNRSGRKGANTSTMTCGGTVASNCFEFVDAILDTVVCRKIWQVTIPDGDARQIETDRIGNWCDGKCIEFLKFTGEFIPVALDELRILY